AVCVVNDLRTGRLRQFEHVAVTELPALFEQFELSSSAGEEVLRYVKSIECWASGVYTWHVETGRYKHLATHSFARAREPLSTASRRRAWVPRRRATWRRRRSRRPRCRRSRRDGCCGSCRG